MSDQSDSDKNAEVDPCDIYAEPAAYEEVYTSVVSRTARTRMNGVDSKKTEGVDPMKDVNEIIKKAQEEYEVERRAKWLNKYSDK